MNMDDKVNILLVDDQASKLLSYEVILQELGENLIAATSAGEALGHLLRHEIAVILIDVCMPDLDGFELATMIRDHPRFQQTAIIFVSAIHLSDIDRLRGYEAGAVDYVPVPVVPEVLRAKVRVFVDLFRKTRALEKLNAELESRVAERTAELAATAARLQESEERRTLALASGQMGSWDWDVRSGAIIWDEGQCRICGITSSQAPRSVAQALRFIHRDDLRHIDALRRGDNREARTFQFDLRLIRADGQIRWCTCAGAILHDPEGNVCRVTGVTTDITQRKRAEESLQKLNDELERRIDERTREREHAMAQLFEAQKLDTIGQLTGGVAHDFNNLLMAILGSLQLLRKRVQDDPRAMRLVDNATQGAERGAALTQRLLAFARRQELRPESVDVRRLVRNMEDLLLRALGSSIVVKLDIPDDLAPVMIDGNQLELALLNLAINARDAMPEGGTLLFSASREPKPGAPGSDVSESFVRICVQDSGVGMDAATLARATEPFFTTKGPGKGTGLGLSMVHGLAAQSGGVMNLHSSPGQGTRVELWLPPAKDAPTPRRRPDRGDNLEPTSGGSRRILVVDDDPLVGAGTCAMLEELGHSVVEAHSAAEAIAVLQADPHFDLMVTDHIMPGMTGAQLAEVARRDHPSLGIVLASGYAELPDAGHRRFVVPRLAKPFTLNDLSLAVSRALAEVERADTEPSSA